MPSAAVHILFYKLAGLSQDEAVKLQAFIDGPARFLGPSHRRVNHSLADFIPYLLVHGKGKGKATKLTAAFASHVLLDRMAKDTKTKVMLELLPLVQKVVGAR